MLREVDSKGRLLLEDGKGQKHTFEVIKKERDIVREVTINNKKFNYNHNTFNQSDSKRGFVIKDEPLFSNFYHFITF